MADESASCYSGAVNFVHSTSSTQGVSSGKKRPLPKSSTAGTIFVLPNGKQRDRTLEMCVSHALNDKTNHWFLLTSSAREQHWLQRNKVLSDQFIRSNRNDDDTDSLPLPPPCVSVVTFECLGVLAWFSNSSYKKWITKTTEKTKQASATRKRSKRRKTMGGEVEHLPVATINSKHAILAIDEAHLLVPYLRTQPTLASSLFKQFGRVFHFTYNIKLCDVGYLLRTFDTTNKAESDCIQNFPVGDDDKLQSEYVQRAGFHTVAQLAKKINGKLIDFAFTAAVLVNVARVPSVVSGANKWADAFPSSVKNDAFLASPDMSDEQSPDMSDEEMSKQIAEWKQESGADNSTTKRFGGSTRLRSHRNLVDSATLRTRTRKRFHRQVTRRRRGGFIVPTSLFSSMVLLTIVENTKPGTANSLGEELWKSLGKITSGFFIGMGNSIKILMTHISPYIGIIIKCISKFNVFLFSHFPKSLSQFRSLGSLVNNALQFIGRRIYKLPHSYRGLTLLYVAFVSALYMAHATQMVVYPPRQYDKNKFLNPSSTTPLTLATFVYVAHENNVVHTRRNPLVHRLTSLVLSQIFHNNLSNTNSTSHYSVVNYVLKQAQCEKAIQWSLRCRRNTDIRHIREGLEVAANVNDSRMFEKLTKRLDAHTNVNGVLFTHFSSNVIITRLQLTSHVVQPWPPSKQKRGKRKTLWIIDEDNLLAYQGLRKKHMVSDIGHIHFLEPTNYSTKQMVYSLCQHVTDNNKFNTVLHLIAGGKEYKMGYQSKVPLQIYEYVSRYPHWINGMFRDFSARKMLSYQQVMHERWLYTPDEIILRQYAMVQQDVQQLQEMYSTTFECTDNGTMVRSLDRSNDAEAIFREALNEAKTYYNARLFGILKDVTITPQERREWAHRIIEEEQNNTLVTQLRKVMKDKLFKEITDTPLSNAKMDT